MTIRTRLVEYTHEGTTLEGFLAWDDAITGRRPAVAVAHAWAGRTAFECEKARQLAMQGYVGFAVDMYGKGVLGTSKEENAKLMTPFIENRAKLQGRIAKAIETLRAQPEVDADRIAAIGFCFGGLTVLDLARSGADVRGVASFHGLFMPPGNTAGKKIKAKVLALHGWDDPMVPPNMVVDFAKEMTEAGADWQLHAFGNTMHAFTLPEANDPSFGTVYSPSADARSWAILREFLREIFA
uniref:Dienelactone hydrolase family protein n=1 Tax=uncultured organism TaxID=155900 RepID=M1Q0Q4_9ZZZZ|nr:dienelactone hydrolase family protein [uncultured organism]